MRARWFLLAQKPNASPLLVPLARLEGLRALFSQKLRKKIMLRTEAKAKQTCLSFGNAVVPAQALSALRTLALALQDSTGAPATSLKTLKRQLPTVVDGTQMLQWPGSESPNTSCQGSGFTVEPPRSEGASVKPIVRETFQSACMPTARTNTNCCLPGRSMTDRTRSDPANFLLSSREMYPNGRVPEDNDRSQLAVTPQFWAINFGFPHDWISEPLATAPSIQQ